MIEQRKTEFFGIIESHTYRFSDRLVFWFIRKYFTNSIKHAFDPIADAFEYPDDETKRGGDDPPYGAEKFTHSLVVVVNGLGKG